MDEFATDQEVLVELTKASEVCSLHIIDTLIDNVAAISRKNEILGFTDSFGINHSLINCVLTVSRGIATWDKNKDDY